MCDFEQLKKYILQLDIKDQEDFYAWISRKVYTEPVISHPQINGGEASTLGTKIPVWQIAQDKKNGLSKKELFKKYPNLSSDQLNNAWFYYLEHSEEIEQQWQSHQN